MAEAAVQEQAPVAKEKVKAVKTGNLILDTAAEVESLTKTKALNMASTLAENIESNYFKLGGVLKVIFDNQWFEGFDSFDGFVYEKFGFQVRKARYLMGIYENLVTKQIPWEKVKDLGWTKLKDLAPVLTIENVDEWVEKASKLTVLELQAALKADGSQSDGEKSTKTKADVVKMTFSFKNDQIETVQAALNKAKAEAKTEYDNVAFEMICTGYLSGAVQIAAPAEVDPAEYLAKLGWEKVLETFEKVFPNVNLEVDVKE